ncbi:hypothetical protein LY632_04090 [Erythrobacter sp. SDW2]|uniref:hypothetical protein n=1 Tax=Erythrobacter sp. SDW2 TaxID=2907154 RepID=UPI001F1E9C0C|nr:hypothetical protein [Erythrobacter sp. SDW2]UIP07590.1 hypothetical protein LY632_04090 [Erythrobacter sp. SDW2]
MLKAVSAVALAALLASCAGGPPRTPRGFIDYALANSPNNASPGKIVAAELAFARLAREKGQWTAFREFATDDAVMFVPEPVNARDWLANQKDPAEAVQWQPHQVWMSCDGSMAVTKGAWQRPDGSFGYFTRVWERQQDGEYKWVLDQGDVLAEPLAEPDIVQSTVADCSLQPAQTIPYPEQPTQKKFSGVSDDGRLKWDMRVAQDRARKLIVSIWSGTQWSVALTSDVAAPTTKP